MELEAEPPHAPKNECRSLNNSTCYLSTRLEPEGTSFPLLTPPQHHRGLIQFDFCLLRIRHETCQLQRSHRKHW